MRITNLTLLTRPIDKDKNVVQAFGVKRIENNERKASRVQVDLYVLRLCLHFRFEKHDSTMTVYETLRFSQLFCIAADKSSTILKNSKYCTFISDSCSLFRT